MQIFIEVDVISRVNETCIVRTYPTFILVHLPQYTKRVQGVNIVNINFVLSLFPCNGYECFYSVEN